MRFARVQEVVGPDVTVVAATKYVSLTDMGTLVEAGATSVRVGSVLFGN